MIYLIAGHQGPGTGAMGLNGADEGAMTIELRDDIANHLRSMGIEVVTDDETQSLRKVLSWLGGKVKPIDLVVDIHFNAFHKPTAHGTEVIVANTPSYMETFVANKLLNATVSALGTRSRGVKPESFTAHRRIGILSGVPKAAVNVLLEVCFITNEKDLKKYDENYGELLRSIVGVLHEFTLLRHRS